MRRAAEQKRPKSWGGRDSRISLRGREVQPNNLDPSEPSSSEEYWSQDEAEMQIDEHTLNRIVDAVRVQVQQQINTNMGEVKNDYQAILERVNAAPEERMNLDAVTEAVRATQINTNMRGAFVPAPYGGNPGEDPLEFLRKFKIHAQEMYGNDEAKWKAFFSALLMGRASNWYVLHKIETEATWRDVEDKFLAAFDSIPPEDRYRLINKRMEGGQTIDSFVKDFMARMTRCKVPSADLVGHFMRALPESYSEKMARKMPDSFMKAVEEARRLERKITAQRADAIIAAGGPTKDLEKKLEDLTSRLLTAAIETREVNSVKAACHYCGYTNHMIRDCRFKMRDESKGIYARTAQQARMEQGQKQPLGNANNGDNNRRQKRCFLCAGPHLVKDCPENPRSASHRRATQTNYHQRTPDTHQHRGTLVNGVWCPGAAETTVQNAQISDHTHSF